MDVNREALKQMIKACNPVELRALLNDLGYPRQVITPALLERVYREQDDESTFAFDFAQLILNSNRLDSFFGIDLFGNNLPSTMPGYVPTFVTSGNAEAPDKTTAKTDTSWSASDWANLIGKAGGFLGDVLSNLNINHAGDANAMAQISMTERARLDAALKDQSSPWPWIIGGLVVMGVIVAIVTTKK